jgi:hypothetical protein
MVRRVGGSEIKETRNALNNLAGIGKERDYLQELGAEKRIILKWV